MKSFLSTTGFSVALATAAITTQETVSFVFTTPQTVNVGPSKSCVQNMPNGNLHPLFMAETNTDNEVVELADDDSEEQQANKSNSDDAPSVAAAPFLSQGEISEEALTMDWSDPKQQRVMFYIILSLLPVLFLIPLMLGSRELIPPEMLPPVEL